MPEFSSIVSIDVDAENRPTALRAFQEGDTIASSIVSINIRNSVSALEGVSSTVFTTSDSWGGGGSPSAPGFEDWTSTSSTVFDGSGDWVGVTTTVNDASDG